jgi:hypothetical protein
VALIEHENLNQKFPWLLAITLYGLSFGPQFFSARNLYWDDWYLVDPLTAKISSNHYAGSGRAPWTSFIESTVQNSSPFVFRIVTFFAFLAAAYFLFKILSKLEMLQRSHITVICLIFLLLPVNSARIALITNAYSISYFLFFLGWYLISLRRSKVFQGFGLICFFLSYTSIGLIPFTILPLIYILILNKQNSLKFAARHLIDFLFLAATPVLYLIFRNIFWPPTNGYREMYTPQTLGLIRGILFVFICSIPGIYGVLFAKWGRSNTEKLLVVSGLFAISVGAFPYMVGGHLVDISDWLIAFIPNFSDWNSRHQLLLPLGIALVLGGALKLDSSKPFRWNSSPTLSIVIIFCVVLNVTFAQEYFLDGKKQEAIMSEMETNEDLKNSSSILIDDTAIRFNARGRLIRSYEWEAMLEKVFGDDSRKVTYLQYVNCEEFQPDAILHISAPNGRLESTLRRSVDIDLRVEKINPCGN